MTADFGQSIRDLLRIHDEVDATAVDRGLGHRSMLGRTLVLSERDPPHRLDLAQPERTVRPRPRKDHRDRLALLLLGERPQEEIDGKVGPPLHRSGREVKQPARDRQIRVRRNDVHVIRADRQPVGRRKDRHQGRLPQEVRQVALVCRVQMLDQHVSHADLGRKMFQKRRKGLKTPGRGADPDDRKGGLPILRTRFATRMHGSNRSFFR